MDIDLDLYRREVRVSSNPLVRLSAIDVSPDHPQRTFVFVHGFGGQAEQWHFQLQNFLIENRVIALDLRGHGLSDKPSRGYEMDHILADLESALDVLKVKGKIVLIGHSFGGAIAIEYALKHVERVERLILIATPGQFKLQPLFKFGLFLPNWILRVVGLFTRKWLSAPPYVLKSFYQHNLSGWLGWEKIGALQLPTLVIRGHRDQVFEREYFESVAKNIPDAQEADIGVSGHMVMLERCEAVNRAIERFLTDEGQRSWRDSSTILRKRVSGRDALRKERPWLAQYEAGVPYTIGIPDIPLHHLLRSAVRRFPLQPAIFFEGSRHSYRYVNHEANRFANALIGLGIGKGARVILLLPNIPQMVIGFYGTLKAGATAVLIPPTIDPDEVIRQAKDADASVLVTLSNWAGLADQIRT
ncbi:MAG: alpha/beta fold hydrolase, partial [Anaerolineales bacterium]